MDPDATLAEVLTLCRGMVNSGNEYCRHVAELLLALDEWLKAGGFLPYQWATCIDA